MLCLASLVFAACVHFAIVKSRDWLLHRDAQSTGMDWARHLEARIPNLSEIMEQGEGAQKMIPQGQDLVNLVREVLSLGHIYQIDFVNAACLCEISFGSFSDPAEVLKSGLPNDHAGHSEDSDTDHVLDHADEKPGNVEIPEQGMVSHVFTGRQSHPPMKSAPASASRLPVDRELMQSIIDKGEDRIILRETAKVLQPAAFAVVYHAIKKDGKPIYIIRMLVDLSAQAGRYTKLLYLGSVLIVVLLVLAFWLPARRLLYTTNKQRLSDEKARYLALHDPLTGIANRNAFQETAPQLLEGCINRGSSSLLLFLIDVDNFKEINDYHGHHVGDDVLVQLAERLVQTVPQGALVARLGGDEFAIVMCGEKFRDTEAKSILALPNQFEIEIDGYGERLTVSVCAGLARFPRDGATIKELMQHADLALYKAKGSRDTRIVEYDAPLGNAFKDRMALKSDFRTALVNGEIVPFYQPLISLKTGRVEGLEALARWRHPHRGIISPAGFQAALEDYEICSLLGSSMLDSICVDMRHWRKSGVDFQSVGLNIGEADLMRHGFVDHVADNLKAFGLQANDLAIEVTENTVYGKNKQTALDRLRKLREMGCYIALDDFGTGYSSITHIKELPCTAVKVDKSFVEKVVQDRVDQAIIRSLRGLGNTAGFKLVVEGVETLAQLELLRTLGCDLAQGYYYSRPVPASEVPAMIERLHSEFGVFDEPASAAVSLRA